MTEADAAPLSDEDSFSADPDESDSPAVPCLRALLTPSELRRVLVCWCVVHFSTVALVVGRCGVLVYSWSLWCVVHFTCVVVQLVFFSVVVQLVVVVFWCIGVLLYSSLFSQ